MELRVECLENHAHTPSPQHPFHEVGSEAPQHPRLVRGFKEAPGQHASALRFGIGVDRRMVAVVFEPPELVPPGSLSGHPLQGLSAQRTALEVTVKIGFLSLREPALEEPLEPPFF
jgi:hypothetical protein